MSGARVVQVTPEEMAVIRRVLLRVPLNGHDQPDLIRSVAVALLDGDDLCFGVGNGWQVTSGAWLDVQAQMPAEAESGPVADDGRIDLRGVIEEARAAPSWSRSTSTGARSRGRRCPTRRAKCNCGGLRRNGWTGGMSIMAIPEDRQQAALREAQETITQTRAAAQAAAQTLTQRKAVLDGLAAKYTPYITEAAGTHNEAVWAGLVAAFTGLKPLVDAAVACAEVEALRTLEV